MRKKLTRREILQRFGFTLSLPVLDCMLPWWSTEATAQALGQSRFMVFYKPNNHYPGTYSAANVNTLPTALASLAPYKSEITIIRGLHHSSAVNYYRGPSGSGDGHSSKMSCFLTGGPIAVSGSVVTSSKSIDQMIAAARGIRPLTLAGPKDFNSPPASGYNVNYCNNLSWVGPNPDARIVSLRTAFSQVFGATTPTPPVGTNTNTIKKSVLDYAMNSITKLNLEVGTKDKQKLDEYFTELREIERSIDTMPTTQQCVADIPNPADTTVFATHTRIMLDIAAKALQCGTRNVITYRVDSEVGYALGLNGIFHHDASHNDNGGNVLPQLVNFDAWYVSQYAYLLGKLMTATEAGVPVLNNSCIIYGGGIGCIEDGLGQGGDVHSFYNLPMIVAGRAKGALPNQGKVLMKKGLKLNNLWATLLPKMGVNVTKFSDSDGTFNDL